MNCEDKKSPNIQLVADYRIWIPDDVELNSVVFYVDKAIFP